MNFGIGPNFRKLGNAREQLNKLTSLTPKQTTKRMRNNNKTPNAIPVANTRRVTRSQTTKKIKR